MTTTIKNKLVYRHFNGSYDDDLLKVDIEYHFDIKMQIQPKI